MAKPDTRLPATANVICSEAAISDSRPTIMYSVVPSRKAIKVKENTRPRSFPFFIVPPGC
ncbi:hypothetical protein D3C80_2001620 [compost metagenome]